MNENTAFNAELIGAESLVIEDDVASVSFQKRRAFGTHIKSITSNEVQSAHGKNRNALVSVPFGDCP